MTSIINIIQGMILLGFILVGLSVYPFAYLLIKFFNNGIQEAHEEVKEMMRKDGVRILV